MTHTETRLAALSDGELLARCISEYSRWKVHREGCVAYDWVLTCIQECKRRVREDIWAAAVEKVKGGIR